MRDPVEGALRARRVETLLRRAAARVATQGWTQRRFHGIADEVCMLQAILDTAGAGRYSLDELADAECRILDAIAGHPVGARVWTDRAERLVAWNDAPGRTAGEVVGALEEAARACAMHPEPAWSPLFSAIADRIAA